MLIKSWIYGADHLRTAIPYDNYSPHFPPKLPRKTFGNPPREALEQNVPNCFFTWSQGLLERGIQEPSFPNHFPTSFESFGKALTAWLTHQTITETQSRIELAQKECDQLSRSEGGTRLFYTKQKHLGSNQVHSITVEPSFKEPRRQMLPHKIQVHNQLDLRQSRPSTKGRFLPRACSTHSWRPPHHRSRAGASSLAHNWNDHSGYKPRQVHLVTHTPTLYQFGLQAYLTYCHWLFP